jgi:hypothetical protein
MKTKVLLMAAIAAGLVLGGCEFPAPTPTPPAITGTWIDAPESGSTILLAPYTLVFHSSSLMGMDVFEVWIEGELISSVPPKTTGPGGSQGTLFMADYEWHPPDPGVYKIEVRPLDQDGNYGPTARAGVTVLGIVAEFEAIPSFQPQPEQLPTGLPTLVLAATPTPTIVPQGIGQPEYSVETVYYRGLGCGPKQVDIRVPVQDERAYSVVLFVRLEDTQSGEKTAWGSIAMTALGNGYFGYSLIVESEMPEAFSYTAANLQVQIVVTDASGDEIGRTPVDSHVLVERCSS